jgi:hypothetical protein
MAAPPLRTANQVGATAPTTPRSPLTAYLNHPPPPMDSCMQTSCMQTRMQASCLTCMQTRMQTRLVIPIRLRPLCPHHGFSPLECPAFPLFAWSCCLWCTTDEGSTIHCSASGLSARIRDANSTILTSLPISRVAVLPTPCDTPGLLHPSRSHPSPTKLPAPTHLASAIQRSRRRPSGSCGRLPSTLFSEWIWWARYHHGTVTIDDDEETVILESP